MRSSRHPGLGLCLSQPQVQDPIQALARQAQRDDLEKRARRANLARARRLLARAPDTPPEPEDSQD